MTLSDDERDGFYSLEERLYDEYRPTCATESLLLDELTLNYWRLQRARRLEAAAFTEEHINHKLLSLYARYRREFERAFYRALLLLRKVKAESAKFIAQFSAAAPGRRPQFVSQNRNCLDAEPEA